MVHTGKPSGACQGCKSRHIKCDETRPSCKRCLASNRICPGYKIGLDLVLRDQNKTAKALVERRSKAKSKSKSSSPERHDAADEEDDVVVQSALSPSVVESEDTHAFCLFVQSWVLYERDPRADRSIPECLTMLMSNLHVQSPLSLAVTALARCLFRAWERRNRDLSGVVEIQKAYVSALEAVRVALSDPTTATSDETLMAVCLLAQYEALVGAFKGQISSTRHFNGALTIAAQRQQQNSMTPATKQLLNAIKCHLAFRAMHNATKIDTKSPVWQPDPTCTNAAILLDQMSADVANALASEKRLQEEDYFSTPPPSEVDTNEQRAALLAEARSVDADLSLWPSLVPSDWHPTPVPAELVPPSVVQAGLYGDTCDVYPDIIVCSTWNDWRSTRLRILGLIARLEPGGISYETRTSIQHMIDGLCHSVPYSLGSRTTPAPLFATSAEYPTIPGIKVKKTHHANASLFGGWYLVCALKEILNHMQYLDGTQIWWIQMQLTRCANIYDVTPQVPRFGKPGARPEPVQSPGSTPSTPTYHPPKRLPTEVDVAA